MISCAAASLAAFLCPQDFPFVLIIRGALDFNEKAMLSWLNYNHTFCGNQSWLH